MTTVRAAAHVHSSWSYDGEWKLDDIAAAFRRRRYDVVLMSEHDRSFDQQRWEEYQCACAAASSDDIVLIPGIEYEDGGNVVHTPVWGDRVPFLGAGRATADLLRDAHGHGAATVLAHPWRKNAISHYTPEWAPFLSALEIWNRKYDGVAPNKAAAEFAKRESIEPFASLDFHTSRQFFPLAMNISLTSAPSAASLAEAIRNGAFEPEFIGFSVLRFTGGVEELALRALETGRRAARDLVRAFR